MNEPSRIQQFWSVSYPITVGKEEEACYYREEAGDEQEAHLTAIRLSKTHGHANVTNREGHVATYVNGRKWREGEHREQPDNN